VIIADTNIVSEFMKDTPEPCVLTWAQSLGAADLTISVVTVEEIDRGLGRLPRGRRRKDLESRWTRLLDAFADTVATYDVTAARATARLLVDGMDQGRSMSLADAQIAGICLTHAATLATRNIKDFTHVGDLTLINPFDHPLH
jgi:toxin FitB